MRFLPQYARAYRGALLASGDGKFYLGLGDFLGDRADREPKLVLEVDGKSHTVSFPTHPGSIVPSIHDWHQVTVVRRDKGANAVFEVWANGKHLCEIPPANTCDLVMEQNYPSNIATPAGPLRVGRRFAVMSAGDQFYGLVDDIALFDTDLSATRIKALAKSDRLSGYEKRLVRAYSFDPEGLFGEPRPPKLLGTPYRARGDRSRAKVTSSRNGLIDGARLPDPSRRYAAAAEDPVPQVPVLRGPRQSLADPSREAARPRAVDRRAYEGTIHRDWAAARLGFRGRWIDGRMSGRSTAVGLQPRPGPTGPPLTAYGGVGVRCG